MDLRPFNPLVETLVHPPSKVEVPEPSRLMKLALKLQAIGKRRGARRDEMNMQQYRVPPELWLIIFDIVLAPVLRTHEGAHYETIPSTMRTLLRFGMHVLQYDDWPRLRLVCRMFHDLLGPNRYQGIRGREDNRVLPKGIEALSMITREEPASSYVALQDLNALSRIRLLDITFAAKSFGRGSIQSIMDDLYALGPNLRSLRSLSICCNGGGRPHVLRGDTWQLISHSFPLLEDLCLWSNQPITECKPATFKNIRTLRTQDVPPTDSVRFPSLQYIFTFRWNPSGAFEKLHAKQLLSLGAGHPGIWIDRRILHLLPNVRHLGAPIASLAWLDVPPPDHPIKHLSAALSQTGNIGATIRQEMPGLIEKLKQMPGVRSLSFGRDGGLPPQDLEYVISALRETNVVSVFSEA